MSSQSQFQIQDNNPEQVSSSYFKQYSHSLQTFKKNSINMQKSEIEAKIQNQLQKGDINIKEQSSNLFMKTINKISSQIHEKNEIFNKDLMLLKWSLTKRSKSVKNLSPRASNSCRSFKKKQKTQFDQNQVKTYRMKQVNAAKKLRQLKEIKQKLRNKRQQQEYKKRLTQLQNQKLIKKQNEQQMKLRNLQKKQRIEKRLKQFEKRKQERTKILKQSTIKSQKFLPKYQLLQKKYNEQEILETQRKRRDYHQKLHRIFMENQPQAIKAHQKQYLEHIRQSRVIRSKTQQCTPNINQLQKNFKIYGKKQQQIVDQKNKKQKMKEFSKVINSIKLKVNPSKHLQIQIVKDRALHPYKYHFFKNKSKQMDDEQIFKKYNKVPLDGIDNSKQLGNKYLKQIRQSQVNSRANLRIKSKTEVTSVQKIQLKPKYKDYLKDSKKFIRRKSKSSIQDLLKKHEKSKIIQMLEDISEQHRKKAIQKIGKWKKDLYDYQKSISIENTIDKEYLKSIQAKLKCISIQ